MSASAATAEADTVTATWVRGRDTGAGWIRFPSDGITVGHGPGGDLGTVTAGKISVNDLTTRRAQFKERLTLQGGLTVDDVLETQDGPPRLVVRGRLDAEGDVNAAGGLTVQGDSLFIGKVNANGHLSVRNKDVGWIMHTRDDLVAINGDLRVHGAFRSDR
ncbi:hypothetical protein K7B10_36500 [Streptomyces flavotricini]|uniref:Polymer-forming cytoskeletal protein n=1 Tax=Streptomyces flavotricini TaxID=66888 RepID=A0ABS8EGH8_9ACTN|nr:hypothetical protein [Streptomyces flavotricini]MCC0100188.1 hypothetical protein [Streptomyces flavotricini]